jgi:glycine cleavage system aminomethyltransferase T
LSVHTSSHPPGSLPSIVELAGGVLVLRHGRAVVANYGSAAGELAACVSAVGLADCSELTKLVLEGPSDQLRHLVSRVTGVEIAPGGAALNGGAWWCADTASRMIVLCDPTLGDRLHAQLHARVSRRAAITMADRSTDWAALSVTGRRTRPLLAELGVYGESGDPRHVPPLTTHAVTGVEVLWLLESDSKAIGLVPRANAGQVWHAIERAGQPFGICAVGHEATERYALIRAAHPSL